MENSLINNSLELFAGFYRNLGFNITLINDLFFDYEEKTFFGNEEPSIESEISSKTPDHKWFHLKVKKQTKKEFDDFSWTYATGVGTVLGYNKLRAIDVDGCLDFGIIEKFLYILGLPSRYEWVMKSGSGLGFHIVFYSDNHEFPVSFNHVKAFKSKAELGDSCFERLELRWAGHLVLPPSKHRSGNAYSFHFGNLPKQNPKEVCVNNVSELVTTFCLDEQVTGASKTFLDYGHSRLSHNISLINEDLGFQFTKPFYLIFDTETTGLLPKKLINNDNIETFPRLVQLAWRIEDSIGKVIEKCNFLIKPSGYFIPSESINIHKIENHIAHEHGVGIEDLLIAFRNRIGMVDYLVNHNMKFDITILQSEYFRAGIWNNLEHKKKYCTMEMGCEIYKNKFLNKFPKLSELYFYIFSEEIPNAHDALGDTNATSKCFRKMMKVIQ